jgi:predicted nucleic acid-binding protein
VSVSDRLFVDTSFVIARFNERDELHAAARSLAPTVGICRELWTTDAVLLEVAASFSRPEHRAIATGLWDQFHCDDPRDRSIEASNPNLAEAMGVFRSRSDKAWSLTDCLSFIVMDREGLSHALSADHHFEKAGFQVMLVK